MGTEKQTKKQPKRASNQVLDREGLAAWDHKKNPSLAGWCSEKGWQYVTQDVVPHLIQGVSERKLKSLKPGEKRGGYPVKLAYGRGVAYALKEVLKMRKEITDRHNHQLGQPLNHQPFLLARTERRCTHNNLLHPVARSFAAFRRSQVRGDNTPVWPFRRVERQWPDIELRVDDLVDATTIPPRSRGVRAPDGTLLRWVGRPAANGTRARPVVEWMTTAEWRDGRNKMRAVVRAVPGARAAQKAARKRLQARAKR